MPQIRGRYGGTRRQFARVAGSFVEAVAVLTVASDRLEAFIKLPVIARIWVHPKIAQS